MIVLVLLALFAYFVGVPTAMWAATREAARRNWPARVAGLDHVAQGSYRDAEVPRMSPAGPPNVVQFAALGAWILGTMFLPGLLGGLGGLFIMGVGAVSIPGLILAWKNFFLAGPLMRGELTSAERARAAAQYTRVLNYVVLALCVVAAVVAAVAYSTDPHRMRPTLTIGGFTALYALISLGHARLLDRAAAYVDTLNRAPAVALTGVRIDATAATVALQVDEPREAVQPPAATPPATRAP